GGLFRRFQIGDTSSGGMQVTAIANFDVVPQTRNVSFQAAGSWYNYVGNGTGTGINGSTANIFTIATPVQNITLQPGEYHVYIYQPSNIYNFIGSGNWSDAANWSYNKVPPTPLPAGTEIYVSPQPGSECILSGPLNLVPGTR